MWVLVVSRAFQVLSDAEKKTKFDKFGGDPDNRFGPGAAASSPFSGFARSTSGARGPMFEDEISPEELFNRFFSGGMGGGMGGGFGPFGVHCTFDADINPWKLISWNIGADMFGGGQQFVFNLNGGPGFRVHQFGGGRPRRRPPGASNGQDERQRSISGVLQNLLPLLILFILPLLSSIFSPGDSTPSGPEFRLSPDPPFTAERATYQLRIPFFINPQDVEDYTARMFTRLDKMVESRFLDDLQLECQGERQRRTRLVQQAQGFFFQDQAKMQEAKRLEMASCQRLASLGVPLYTY